MKRLKFSFRVCVLIWAFATLVTAWNTPWISEVTESTLLNDEEKMKLNYERVNKFFEERELELDERDENARQLQRQLRTYFISDD